MPPLHRCFVCGLMAVETQLFQRRDFVDSTIIEVEEQEKYQELYEINKKMTEWMLQNFEDMIFE